MKRLNYLLLACVLALSTAPRPAPAQVTQPTLYMVGASHLDTQWWWSIQTTILDLIPATFQGTFERLEAHPAFNWSWEGAFRYMLLEEYYPDLFAQLDSWVWGGRWKPSGSALDAGDVNVPSPESLFRQFLYGNGWFRRVLGVESRDVFLPDCFGFGWALPSVAAHAGLKGFSTQKLTWGVWAPRPFEVGVWQGPDGGSVVAALNPGAYVAPLTHDLSQDPKWQAVIEAQEAVSGVPVAYGYFGVGDQGGAVPEESVAWLDASLAGEGPVTVKSAFSDQMFLELSDDQVAALPRWNDELLLSAHGTGSYTAQAAMKRWNRRNEQLADAAERASLAASLLGGAPYDRQALTDAWIRFLWHQFHDDLTGTGIPEDYAFSWNDELLALNRFASVLTRAVGTVARALDTRVTGQPLVVHNPLAVDREDLVEATVRWEGAAPQHVRVYDPDGREVPAQVRARREHALDVTFLAFVPSMGYAVFDVRSSEAPGPRGVELSVSAGDSGGASLENARYKVTLNAEGDLASVFDKVLAVELLTAPARLALFDDFSMVWPAWEIPWDNLRRPPRAFVAGPAQVQVVEDGPARVTLQVTRTAGDSRFVQRIRLASGGAADRLEVEAEVDWHSRKTALKAWFPLATPNPQATYDLGLGTIRRGNDTKQRYEVPAQQWADLSLPDGSRGVSVLNDCKYGWNKPDDGTLGLTLLHTPIGIDYHHDTLDLGHHRFTYALYGHTGDWRNGTAWQAARLNQPLMAFQTFTHDGALGAAWSLGRLDTPQVMLKALKAPEETVYLNGEEYQFRGAAVVRLHETWGQEVKGARLRLGSGKALAYEADGGERLLDHGPLPVDAVSGEVLLDFQPYQVRTILAWFNPVGNVYMDTSSSQPVGLPFDTDVASNDWARADGAFATEVPYGDTFADPDCDGRPCPRDFAYPAELLPEFVSFRGVDYMLGSTQAGAPNAVTCRGQSVRVEAVPGERLYLLAAATQDLEAQFTTGGQPHTVAVQAWSGFIGQWDSRVDRGRVLADPSQPLPGFVKPATVAWYGTHRHRADADDPYVFTYLYEYVLPVPPGTSDLVLPDDPRVRVFAASLVKNPGDRTVAASVLHDGFQPESQPIDWSLMPRVVAGGGGGAGCAWGGWPGTDWAWLLVLLALAALASARAGSSLR
jgi:alpha-mannosidase